VDEKVKTHMNESPIPLVLCACLLACQANVDPDDRQSSDGGRLEGTALLHGPGPHGLHVIDELEIPGRTNGRTITASVCAPGESAALSTEGPYPLIIIAPGAKQSREQYMSYCKHLATWGFFVVAQDIVGNDALFPPANHKPLAADLSAIIDWATSEQNELAGAIDGDAIGVAGHSLGGKVAFLAAATDARIGAVVGWDPVDANAPFTSPGSASWSSATPELMPDLTQPIAVIGETLNSKGGAFAPACAPAEQNFQQYYEHAETTAFSVEVFKAEGGSPRGAAAHATPDHRVVLAPSGRRRVDRSSAGDAAGHRCRSHLGSGQVAPPKTSVEEIEGAQ
jgi:dienelactone hydrolase